MLAGKTLCPSSFKAIRGRFFEWRITVGEALTEGGTPK
jgi:hypothetical protein